MDFHLQNVRTGEIVKLPPERALIGAAEHADVLTDDSPYLAALAVRYPTGWALFGLSDEGVRFNRRPLRAAQRVTPRKGDLLAIGESRFTFLAPNTAPDDESEAEEEGAPPDCFAYITNPDGMEECRAVDHDLLFGRLEGCHVQLSDTRLSRLGALLASHAGTWYIHTLSKKALGRNRKAVNHFARVADGDELLIGPLVVRIEIRPPTAERAALPALTGSRERPPLSESSILTDLPASTDGLGGAPDPGSSLDILALHARGQQLENWLKKQPLPVQEPKSGLGGWLGAQRDRLRRFWLDTPETTSARSLRTAGRLDDAFTVLDRAIRTRPDGPELLRELYRLYEAVALLDLCYRPLRQIEKLAQARGTSDPWVFETLARLCERLGRERPEMYDRAIGYWNKLESATGQSCNHQKNDVMARRALHEGGYAGGG